MADESREVETQEQIDVQNTDTDLEQDTNEEASSTESEVTPTDGSEQGLLSGEDILSLGDAEFNEYFNKHLKVGTSTPKETKDGSDNTLPSSSTKSRNDNKSSDSVSEGTASPTDKRSTKPTVSQQDKPKLPSGTGTSTEDGKSEKGDIDYKSVYETIFKPFKANGKMIQPESVDDIVRLMQMGSNYTQKMQQIAGMKKTVDSLQKANVNTEDLSFLIDVHNGNKEAIKKLLQKHNVDPMELDLDSTNYVPNNNIVSDEEVEYSNTLDEIKPSLPKIREILDTKWDTQSKKLLLEHPDWMVGLHEEIELGRFDEVQTRLETAKALGKFRGKPDVVAYMEVVNQFLQEKQTQPIPNMPTNGTKSTSTPKKDIPDKSKAAPTKTKGVPVGPAMNPKDILTMSDEEFKKINLRNFM